MGRRRTPVQREFDPARWARPVEGALAGIITGQVLRTLLLPTPRPTCGVLADGSASETHPSALACSDISCHRKTLGAPRLPKRLGHPPGPARARWQRRARHGPRDLVLLETGDVDVLTRDDGEAVYFRCSRQHHHLVCRSCGYAIEITGPAAKRWADALAERHGYADITHTLEVFGLLSGLLASVSRYALTPVVAPALTGVGRRRSRWIRWRMPGRCCRSMRPGRR
jgi:Ferric uptake regulator family